MLRKHTALIFVLGIAASSVVFAHASNTVIAKNQMVFVPGTCPAWEVSFAAIALKPGASNLNYVIYNKELPAQSPRWREKELSPRYDFAFELAGRYIMLEGKDAQLSWTHLDSTTTATQAAPNANFFLGPDYEIGGTETIPIRNAIGNVQFKYDVLNLDFGQWVNFGRNVQMRFFGGLSNAWLREQVNATYSGVTLTGPFRGPFNMRQQVTANFTGLGPRFGFEGVYTSDYGFGLFGEAGASALIGSSYAKTNYVGTGAKLRQFFHQSVNNQFIQDQNIAQVIPAFDAKLGVNYKRNFTNGTMLTLKAGYQAAVYINALNQYLPASLVEGAPLDSGGIFVATMSHTQSNYSVQGPFLEAAVAI